MPYVFEIAANVISSRSAANATLAFKSGEWFWLLAIPDHRSFNPAKLTHRNTPQILRKSRNCRAITARYAQPDGRFARSAQMFRVRVLIPSDSGSVLKGQDPAFALVPLAFETLLKDRRNPLEALHKLTKQMSYGIGGNPSHSRHKPLFLKYFHLIPHNPVKLTNHVSRNKN